MSLDEWKCHEKVFQHSCDYYSVLLMTYFTCINNNLLPQYHVTHFCWKRKHSTDNKFIMLKEQCMHALINKLPAVVVLLGEGAGVVPVGHKMRCNYLLKSVCNGNRHCKELTWNIYENVLGIQCHKIESIWHTCLDILLFVAISIYDPTYCVCACVFGVCVLAFVSK